MREKIKALFPIWKWARVQMIVIIILTAIICLTIPREYQTVREMQKESGQVWEQHIERIENIKDNGVPVEETKKTDAQENSESKAVSLVAPIKAKAEDLSSAPASGIEKKIFDKFGKDGEVALAVAKAESRLNPTAINVNRNGTKDAGIFQINDCHGFSVEERFNADKNIEIAFALYQKSGFRPWVTFKTNTYKQFL